MVSLGVLGGIAAGLLVSGIGGRLVMRILAVVNGEKAGVLTENEAVSGQITAGGTLFLIIIVGVVTGIIGGLIYVVLRRWLPGSGLLRGVVFGLVLFCFFGSVFFDPANVDFALFGPRPLSVGLFALLFLLYGVVASILVERFDQYVPPLFATSRTTTLGYLVLSGACGFGLFLTVRALNAIL